MKKRIALIAGGDSGEYPVSIKSATMVAQQIDSAHYTVYFIEIKKGHWVYKHPELGEIAVNKDDFSLNISEEKIVFDLVFNMIHGSPGENGKLLGYFDILGIPYTSCSTITSALTFNKAYCNAIVQNTGVAVSKNMHLFKKRTHNADEILRELSLPVFVKPNQGGSSVGMSKVTRAEELAPALEKAFAEDDEILVEEFVKGRELTCGVFEYNGKIIRFPITEIISKKEFFDFEAKYDPKLADEITPAQISEQDTQRIQDTAENLYILLNCKGITRFDFILNNDNLWFIEVNTVPGMSDASIVPQQVRAMGYTLTEFYSMLIEESLRS